MKINLIIIIILLYMGIFFMAELEYLKGILQYITLFITKDDEEIQGRSLAVTL